MEDTRWARRAWDDPQSTSVYAPEPGSLEEAKTAQALSAVREHPEILQAMTTAPPPDRMLTGMPRRALGIRDVVTAVRRPMTSSDFSGQPGGFVGSLRNVLTPFG